MRLVPVLSEGLSADNGLALIAMPFDGDQTLVWNEDTNIVPLLTAPSISIVYASDRRSATVTMSCNVAGSIIRYCTNGRYATTHCNSPIYREPITVYQSSVFHACWYFNGLKSYASHASVYLKL